MSGSTLHPGVTEFFPKRRVSFPKQGHWGMQFPMNTLVWWFFVGAHPKKTHHTSTLAA
jgi:hypothetical protein